MGLATFNRNALFDDWSMEKADYEVSRVFTNSPQDVGGIIAVREYAIPESYTDIWFHYDFLGSVINHSNGSGAATASYHQDAYGNVVDASTGVWLDESSQAGFHLTTKEYDADIGLYFFSARWYMPELGIYARRGPLRIDEEHPYGFAHGNPITFIDPRGLTPLVVGGSVEDRRKVRIAVQLYCKNLRNPAIDWTIYGKYSSKAWLENIKCLRACAEHCCKNAGSGFHIRIGGLYCWVFFWKKIAGYTPPLAAECHFHVCPAGLEYGDLLLNTVAHETMHSCGLKKEAYATDIGDEFGKKIPFPE